MNRIDRLFGILILLQSKKHVSAETIASRFEISVRTVYRDVKALTEQGVPLSFEPNKGYFIVQGYFLPPVSFNTDEASALLMMERFIEGFADKSIKQHYQSALDKVKNVLKSNQREVLENLNANIRLQLPKRLYSDVEYLSLLQNAIADKNIVSIKYKNYKEEISERRLEPIGLIFYAFSWHLIGYCHLRSSYRDFKVNNILQLNCSSLPFTLTEHISINDYMKQLPVDY
ncbi:helix-turn-helix transcriptional regulator [Pedobacter xixiisoli]|uniref:WYL domain-containing protein n=1 Tax=Pedobacter xixiisoli TaxID=1476464 RepID=A0A286AEP3_9SPHI|nr:YafY family protein [Pedobacter xixiisoli]SOD20366.1 WYL domain-containing protein [Pedobacter xixiisoli]